MADKAATVFVLDVGRSMGERHGGRAESDLELGLKYVHDSICNTVFTNRKTDQIGIVTVRTAVKSDTCIYNHVATVSGIKQFLLEDVRKLQDIKAEDNDDGNIIEGIQQAIENIETHCRNLKYKRSIMVVARVDSPMVADTIKIQSIRDALKKNNIRLVVLLIDMESVDAKTEELSQEQIKTESLSQPSDVSPVAAENVRLLQELCSSLDNSREGEEQGIVAPYSEALASVGIPKPKKVRPIASFRGSLTIGSAALFGDDRSVQIELQAYPCTRKAMFTGSHLFAVAEDDVPLPVEYAREYFIDNEKEPDKREIVTQGELEQGYKYGSEIVPLSSDIKVLLGATKAVDSCLEFIATVDAASLPRSYYMSNTDYVIPAPGMANAVAFSALVLSLFDLDKIILARYSRKPGADVVVVGLSPLMTVNDNGEPFEALISCELPFAEDVRHYQFPSLSEVKTRSGKVLEGGSAQREMREPTAEMTGLMEQYVDDMDLMIADEDADGEPVEWGTSEEVYNPMIHRMRQVIKTCALSGSDADIPPIPSVLTQFTKPPPALQEKAKSNLAKLTKVLDIKKVEKSSLRDKKRHELYIEKTQAKKEGLDIDGLLG